MSQARGILVPVEHLTAEMAAIPLASPAALGLSVVQMEAKLGHATGHLWRKAESELVSSFPSFSIDELVSLRDWLWFHDTPKERPVYLSDYISRVAEATLTFNGNVFQPRLPPWATEMGIGAGSSEDALARRFWRWISFAVPPDLLMAAHPAPDAVAAQIDLVSPLLTRILQDQGYAEPHMHVGAALEFPLLWIATLHALANPKQVNETSFYSPGAQLEEGREMGHWLIRAATARYMLAVFLEQNRSEPDLDFDHFLEENIFPAFRSRSDSSAYSSEISQNPILGAYSNPMMEPLLRTALRELACGKLDPNTRFIALQRMYVKLTAIRMRWPSFPQNLEDALCADPLQGIFPARGRGQRSSEMEWMAAGLSYLNRRGNSSDPAFSHLFWQTVRVRNLYYRHVVQRPLTPGLQWFVRFFARMWPGRAPISLQLGLESAATLCGRGMGLRAMEFRTTPRATQSDMENVIREAKRAIDRIELTPKSRLDSRVHSIEQGKGESVAANYNNQIEYGLVLHFSRERGGGASEGLPSARGHDSHADPSWNKNLGYRFGRFYREKRQEALTLARLIQRFPRVLSIIRGLDLCTDEVGVPTWVMAPLVRYVRQVSRTASAELQSVWGEDLPPLRMTVHAGEEYVHLLGGLRRVDEAIDYMQLGQGDRLGHAMALGADPKEWALRSSGIAVTRMDRLLDLAWEWSFSANRGIDIPGSRIQYIIDQIERLSREIFGEFADPTQVVRFAELLRQETELRSLNFPSGPLPDVEGYVRKRRTELLPESMDETSISLGSEKATTLHDRSNNDVREFAARLEHTLPAMFKVRQGDEPWRLLANYMIDPATFHRGQTLMLVDPGFEADALQMLQDELRRKVGSLGITVEINPSSNLLIGNLADLDTHPLWRLKPPRHREGIGSVAVCIGSDDPLTFSTRTREEYQLVYDTLTLAGLSDVEARQWLEDARQTGLVSRFTLKSPVERERIWTAMKVDVSHLEPLL